MVQVIIQNPETLLDKIKLDINLPEKMKRPLSKHSWGDGFLSTFVWDGSSPKSDIGKFQDLISKIDFFYDEKGLNEYYLMARIITKRIFDENDIHILGMDSPNLKDLNDKYDKLMSCDSATSKRMGGRLFQKIRGLFLKSGQKVDQQSLIETRHDSADDGLSINLKNSLDDLFRTDLFKKYDVGARLAEKANVSKASFLRKKHFLNSMGYPTLYPLEIRINQFAFDHLGLNPGDSAFLPREENYLGRADSFQSFRERIHDFAKIIEMTINNIFDIKYGGSPKGVGEDTKFLIANRLMIRSEDEKPYEIVSSDLGLELMSLEYPKPNITGWNLHELLGEGAFAKVWRAENDNGITYALKIIKKTSFNSDLVKKHSGCNNWEEYIKNELFIAPLSDLDTPYVLKMDIPTQEAIENTSKEKCWLVPINEICDGNLETLVNKGNFNSELAFEFSKQIIEALADCHTNPKLENPIVHKDLKPANILIINDEVRISDFGALYDFSTNPGEYNCLGALAFKPPEVIEANITGKIGSGYSERSNVFSIGCIIYWMYTKETPYKFSVNKNASNPMKERERQHKEMLNEIEKENVDYQKLEKIAGRHIKDSVKKCLQKDPKNRYANALELKEDLYKKLKINH